MSEHLHKWRLQNFNNESGGVTIGVADCECGEVIGPTEIERRLNWYEENYERMQSLLGDEAEQSIQER